jgi:nucleoside-diphosphate-sugar epimerase
LIFVTGGTGFLGRHLVPLLCQSGYSLRLLTRHPETHPWLERYPNVEVFSGDLSDRASVEAGMQGCDMVVHAGGLFRFWGKQEWFQETNVIGTQHVMQTACRLGVEKVIHISSIAVIGQPDADNIMDEDSIPHPVDPYQRSKLEAEQIALSYWRDFNLPVSVLRPGAYYGPMGEYAFNRLFFRDPMRGIIMQVDGGRYIIFPAYIADVAQGILLALQRGEPGEIYNICGDWISHKDAFDIVTREATIRFPRLPIPGWMGINFARVLEAVSRITRQEPFYPINLQSYVYNNWRVSNAKARRELGFVPTAFEDGARQTLAWYRAGKPEHLPELDC